MSSRRKPRSPSNPLRLRWKPRRQGERGKRERRPVQVREEHFPGWIRLCVRSESTRVGCRTAEWIRSLRCGQEPVMRQRRGERSAGQLLGEEASTSQFPCCAQGKGGPKSWVL